MRRFAIILYRLRNRILERILLHHSYFRSKSIPPEGLLKEDSHTAMTDSAPSSPIFSSVNYGDESDEDILDFGPGRSVFEDASGIPDIDTIDHSTLSPVTAVNPLARRIIMDDFDSDFEGDDMFSTRKLPLGVPLDDTDEEELTSSEDESTSKHRESQSGPGRSLTREVII